MQGYQPRPGNDVVYFDGEAVNTTSYIRLGTGVRIDEIDGWEGNADIRDERENKIARDGENADSSHLGGRTVTISGYVHGSSWSDLQNRKRNLAAMFAHESTERLLKIPDPTSSIESSYYEYQRDLPDLVALWRLDESSGNVVDKIASRVGTVSGNPTYGNAGPIAADESTCMDFDGTGDWIDVAYAAALNPAAVSLEAWFTVETDDAIADVLYDTINGNTGFRVLITTGEVPQVRVGTGAGVVDTTATSVIAQNTWTHVVFTNDGANTRIYVNGQLEITAAAAYSPNLSGAACIGALVSHTNRWTGKIANVAIYNDDLSADEVLQLYRRGAGTVGSNDTDGYEHSTCRVIDSVVFGEMGGPHAQAFSVALRASDPRIYSDMAIVESGSGAASFTNDSLVPTPASIASTIELVSFPGEVSKISCSTGGQICFIRDRLQDGDIVTARTPDRTADWQTPYHNGRLQLFDPVAYWRLNETAGATADNAEGTSSYDGTYTNTPLLNQAGHAASIIAANFNGTDEYVTVPFAAALNPTVMSCEAWVKFDTISSPGILGSFRNNGGAFTGYKLHINGNTLQLTWWTGTGTTSGALNSTTGFQTGTWYHVAFVLGANGAALYINGELDVAVSYAGAGAVFAPVAAASAFTMGRATDGAGTAYMDGSIDNVVLFDRALTATDIAALYAASAAVPTFEDYGGFAIEPIGTSWFMLEPGDVTILGADGIDAVSVTYREARI